MKYHNAIRIILIVLITLFILSGCSILSENIYYVNSEAVAREQGEIIMEAVINKDAEAIAELFCPYIKEKHPELESEIEELFAFIAGDIISYDEVRAYPGSKSSKSGEGIIEASAGGYIENIKTDTGNTYLIVLGVHIIDKDKPEYVGITDLRVRNCDLYNKGMEYPNIAKYKISSPEMWE